jgi:hypothetical protein
MFARLSADEKYVHHFSSPLEFSNQYVVPYILSRLVAESVGVTEAVLYGFARKPPSQDMGYLQILLKSCCHAFFQTLFVVVVKLCMCTTSS